MGLAGGLSRAGRKNDHPGWQGLVTIAAGAGGNRATCPTATVPNTPRTAGRLHHLRPCRFRHLKLRHEWRRLIAGIDHRSGRKKWRAPGDCGARHVKRESRPDRGLNYFFWNIRGTATTAPRRWQGLPAAHRCRCCTPGAGSGRHRWEHQPRCRQRISWYRRSGCCLPSSCRGW